MTIFQEDGDIAPFKLGPCLQHAAWRTSIWQRQIWADYSVSVSNIHPSGLTWWFVPTHTYTYTRELKSNVWVKCWWMLEPPHQQWEMVRINQIILWLLLRCHPVPSFKLILFNVLLWFSINTGLRNDNSLTPKYQPHSCHWRWYSVIYFWSPFYSIISLTHFWELHNMAIETFNLWPQGILI